MPIEMKSAEQSRSIRRKSSRTWRIVFAAVITLALIATGGLVWNESRADLRAFDPFFSTAQGSIDCVTGIETALSGISTETSVSESDEGCSSMFTMSANDDEIWNYLVKVQHSEFETGSRSFYGSADPGIDTRECGLFSDAGVATRYIDGAGGFCMLRTVLPENGPQRTLTSEMTFARFGRQITIEITAEPIAGTDLLTSHPITAITVLAFLEYRFASTFADQLDPTGAIDEQLRKVVPASSHVPEVFPEAAESWCGDIVSVDLAAIANRTSTRHWERYEAAQIDQTAKWWESDDTEELHCSDAWTVDRWSDEPSGELDKRFGFSVNAEITPWVWGPEALADEVSLRSAACRPLDESVMGAFDNILDKSAEQLSQGHRCLAIGEPAELLFLLDDHRLVRVSTYSWDESGSAFSDSVTSRWDEAVQLEVAEGFLGKVAGLG